MGCRQEQGTPFWPPLSPVDKPEFDKHRGGHILIYLYFNLLNLLIFFKGGMVTSMHKAAYPSGGMGS